MLEYSEVTCVKVTKSKITCISTTTWCKSQGFIAMVTI